MQPAEVFPLGEFIREELIYRGMGVESLCQGTCMPAHRLQRIMDDPDDYLTFREAEWLADSLGVSPVLLLTIQLIWRKRKK